MALHDSVQVELVNLPESAETDRLEAMVRQQCQLLRVRPELSRRQAPESAGRELILDGAPVDIARLSGLAEPEQGEMLRLRVAQASGLRTILFVCTGNAIRSQIAEGLVNHLFHGEWAAFSAGTMPMGIQKETVKVMREVGVDLSGRFAKSVDLFRECTFDQVVILCSDAGTRCPVFPYAGKVDRMFFDDPLSPDILSGAIFWSLTTQIRGLRKQMQKALVAYLEAKG